MELISAEQLEVLMMVAGSDKPMETAMAVRRRWTYILGVARAAQNGYQLDHTMPQVMDDCHTYVTRAEKVVQVLDEWMAERRT